MRMCRGPSALTGGVRVEAWMGSYRVDAGEDVPGSSSLITGGATLDTEFVQKRKGRSDNVGE